MIYIKNVPLRDRHMHRYKRHRKWRGEGVSRKLKQEQTKQMATPTGSRSSNFIAEAEGTKTAAMKMIEHRNQADKQLVFSTESQSLKYEN